MITSFLTGVGGKVPLSWLTRIVLPGILLILTIICVHGLGWAHAFDYAAARAQANALLATGNGQHGATGLFAVTVVAGGIAAGFLANVTSHAISAVFTRLGRPGRHIQAVTKEVGFAYGGGSDYDGLSLRLIWPRIWLLCPEAARQEIQAAWDQYGVSTILAAWGFFYFLLGFWWPPSLLVGLLLLVTAYWQASNSAEAFAELTRAAVDITITRLATTLGITIQPGRTIGEDEARRINEKLRPMAADLADK
jgi:hypothetical protein